MRAIVLAGERPGGSALARALDIPAAVLAPLAGRPCLLHVVDALRGAASIAEITLCGPARHVVDHSRVLSALVAEPDVTWVEPAAGPAASALAAADGARFPQLLTSGDHGLLQASIVDAFCQAAGRADGDFVVGLVPHERVREVFPDSRRTVLRFADGAFCGSNLFALRTEHSRRALSFWRSVEADRKRPWRIARRLGPATLARYLAHRLSVDAAFDRLSELAGCRVGWVEVAAARAAVDVDSEADWRLAERILQGEANEVRAS